MKKPRTLKDIGPHISTGTIGLRMVTARGVEEWLFGRQISPGGPFIPPYSIVFSSDVIDAEPDWFGWIDDEPQEEEMGGHTGIGSKPPLGLRPRGIVDEFRAREILKACLRYMEFGWQIPTEWLCELREANARLKPSPPPAS